MKKFGIFLLAAVLSLPVWAGNLDAAKAQGVKFSDDNKTLVKCPANVTSVIIPSCVTTIGDYAFDHCSNLTDVTIPDSVTSIGENAFFGCSNLTDMTIPASVTAIGDYAFSNCSNLTSVTIPASVTTIGDTAFNGVKSVKVADDNPVFMVDDAGALIDIENGRMLYFPKSYQGSYVIPDGITTIGEWTFSSCDNLTSVTIPASVTTIRYSAFSGCKNLTSVTIPDSVTTIGEMAFSGCSKLTSVTIGNSVTTIGEMAFSGCFKLTSVTIGNSVTTIGDSAFSSCSNLTSVTIPDSVTTIGEWAFSWCENLTSVTIPASVTIIEDGAFCSVKSVKVADDNPAFMVDDAGALIDIENKVLLYFPPDYHGSYVIPDGVTTIGGGAFYGCYNLTSVTIPANAEYTESGILASFPENCKVIRRK